MKNILSLFMLMMMVIVTGCCRIDFGMDIKSDGSVDVKIKSVGEPSVMGNSQEELKKWASMQKVTPVKAGKWIGHEAVNSYKDMTDLAKSGELFFGLSDPKRGIETKGILYKAGFLYDCCAIDLVMNPIMALKTEHNDYNVPDAPGAYFYLRLPSGSENNNADIVSSDNKVLAWDLTKIEEGKNYKSIKANFKIWHRGTMGGLVLLALALLGAGAVFFKKSSAAYDVANKKNGKIISCASLGVAAVIIAFMATQITAAPTLTNADRVSPVKDTSGRIVAAGSVTQGETTVPKANTNKGNAPKPESKKVEIAPVVPKANNGQASASAEYPAITKSAYVNAYHSSADQEGNYVHSAKLTIDGNTGSCWSEGVKGIGIGENIEIHFNGNYKVSGMNIWIGHQKSQDLFSQNARPTALRVEGSDGSKEIYNLEDKFGPQRIAFKTPITANKVKLIVERVAPGSKYEDTCISEVEFF